MKFKPKIKYTEMCIWIDANAYNENGFDEEKMFEYLRCLFYALAFKKRFFNKTSDYENYALYGATQAYMRLKNSKQFLPDDDPHKRPKVKSILNYIKKMLYGMKVNYQKSTFGQVYSDEVQGLGTQDKIKDKLYKNILSNTKDLISIEVETYLSCINRIIKTFLKNTPYANDKQLINNLYTSCLITLLKGITLSRENKEKLKSKLHKTSVNEDNLITQIFNEERLNAPTNWHLPKGMEDLVAVYVVKINKLIIRDIRGLIGDHTPTEDILEDILMSPLANLGDEDND